VLSIDDITSVVTVAIVPSSTLSRRKCCFRRGLVVVVVVVVVDSDDSRLELGDIHVPRTTPKHDSVHAMSLDPVPDRWLFPILGNNELPHILQTDPSYREYPMRYCYVPWYHSPMTKIMMMMMMMMMTTQI